MYKTCSYLLDKAAARTSPPPSPTGSRGVPPV